MRRIALVAVVSLAACSDPEHKNPFDPASPADRQARTAFSGTVSLEAVGGVAPGLAGVTVSVAGHSWSATTDASGAYEISGVPPGTYTVQAVLPGYEPAAIAGVTATLDTGGTTVALPALALRRVRADLTGSVLLRLPDATYESTGGARVSISVPSGTTGLGSERLAPLAAGSGTALTGADGSFVIPELPAPIGSYTLTASKYGYVTQSSTVTFQSGAFVVQTVQLVVDPGAIVGSVAIAGATDAFGVTVRARGATVGGTPWEQVTTTDASGAFRISGLPAGTYAVSYERADLVTAAASARAVAPGADTTLDLVTLNAASGAIRGVVQLSGMASSSAGVVVTASGPGSGATVTDSAGAFTLTGLPVGTYAVMARKDPDWQPASTPGVVVTRDAAATLAAVVLSPWATASISGFVALEGGASPTDCLVTLAGSDFRGLAVGRTTSPGTGGGFSFPALVAGSYQLVFSNTGYDTPAPVGVSLGTGQAGAVGSVTLAASRGGAAGTVTALGAASHAGTVVTVSGGPDTASAVTDAAGHWSLSGLRVGTGYAASYQRTAYAAQTSASFAVSSGAVTAVPPATLTLATSGSLSGTIAVERGSADAVDVVLTGTDVNGAAVSASGTSAADGSWAISNLRQGTYGATFSKAGYDAASLTGLSVGAGATIAPAVTLAVSRGTVAGTVALSAGAIDGFAVGGDFSGVVVTLGGIDPPVAAAVTDASGAYRFADVPVSLVPGATYEVTARKTWFETKSTSVTALANATVDAPALTLRVAAGHLTGNARLTERSDGGDALPSANVGISIAGTAFNGASFTAATLSATNGSWTSGALPPGSYDVVATLAHWTCAPYPRASLGSGVDVDAGAVLCLDATPPTAPVLAAPAVTPPQQAGYTAATSVDVSLAVPATDTNLSAYALALGASPDWGTATSVPAVPTPAALTFDGLAADARNVLWVRAVDAAGNAGPAASLEIVQDSQDPARPVLSTARAVVDDTSATVSISGSEGDANFYGYEAATATVAAADPCPASPDGAFAASPASAALTLAANQKTCFFARAVDRAGRVGPQETITVTSDLVPPAGPTIAPLYDPSLLTVHAESADFFVTGAATDRPAGGADWEDVAWVEVDTGSGYRPLCPSPACHPDGVYAPCSPACACGDARLVCDGTRFSAIRVPLLDGTSNTVGIRAVDLAGNVGSGASQRVATATSLLPVSASSASESHARGRGRLIGYRYTDVYLRLQDLGDDGRPGADDLACNIGYLGTVTPRVAVLGPAAVVHGDGDLAISVRRPGTDGLFCSPAPPDLDPIDDTETTIYSAAPPVTILSVTGSYDRLRTGEYAAWAERDGASAYAVNVKAPGTDGRLVLDDTTVATLFTLDAPASVTDLLEGGDCLLSSLGNPMAFRVDCQDGGLDGAAPTTWTLPAQTRAAALSADGTLLAWLEVGGATPGLHVRSAGPDLIMGNGDDTFATRSPAGPAPSGGFLAIEAGHLVLSETSRTADNAYWLVHWSAGPDGVFEDQAVATADDTIARVLPYAETRENLSILSGGLVAYSVYGLSRNLVDLVSSDLSTFRWEAIEASGFNGLATNGAGTLFFHRGVNLTARLPDATEQQRTPMLYASSFAADGANLVTVEGSSVYLRRRTGGRWFMSAGDPALPITPITVYTGAGTDAPADVAAGGGWALIRTSGNRYLVANLSDNPPTPVLLDLVHVGGDDAAPNSNGFGISDKLVAYQCLHPVSGYNACVHLPGTDGRFGSAGSATLLLARPGILPVQYYGVYALAVGGDKIAFRDGSGHLVVAVADADGQFNTGRDVHHDLGPAASTAAGSLIVAGDYAAWLQIPGTNGVQITVANLPMGTQRHVTSHYSMKELLAMDPSGRLAWIDYGFSAPAIFLYAP